MSEPMSQVGYDQYCLATRKIAHLERDLAAAQADNTKLRALVESAYKEGSHDRASNHSMLEWAWKTSNTKRALEEVKP